MSSGPPDPPSGLGHPTEDGGPGAAYFGAGLLAGAVTLLLALALISPLRDAVLPSDTADDQVTQALQVIGDSYFEETDPSDLADASVEGMVRRIKKENDDRFSHFFDAETFDRFNSATSGQFSGVGLTVSEVKPGLRVARVFEDTPAAKADIQAGDVITAVDGKSIAGESSDVASAEIKGPPGTEVTLTIKDAKSGRSKDLDLERAEVRIPAVQGEIKRLDGTKIAYAQLATFSSGAHGELRKQVEELYDKGAEGVILDLRGNGGGLLQEAVLVSSIFQEEGPVVTTEGRTRPEQTLDATGNALAERPMAILTNGDTASSSEIVAASLQQNDIATVIGTRTFGKGTFQEVIELDGGSALDLTVGEYLTSDGTSINGVGIKPDIRVPDEDASDGDDTLDRGLEVVADEINGS